MDIAERNGADFLRSLRSAECFNDCAIFFGSFASKIFCSRSRASLFSVTLADHFLPVSVFFFCAISLHFFGNRLTYRLPFKRANHLCKQMFEFLENSELSSINFDPDGRMITGFFPPSHMSIHPCSTKPWYNCRAE